MRDAVGGKAQHIAVRIGDRLHAARLINHIDELLDDLVAGPSYFLSQRGEIGRNQKGI